MEKSDLNPDPDPEILGIDPRDLPIPILPAIHWWLLVTLSLFVLGMFIGFSMSGFASWIVSRMTHI